MCIIKVLPYLFCLNQAAAPAPASAPEPAPAPTEASPAPAAAAVSAGTEGSSSTGASVDVASASAETGASAASTETGAAQEGTSSETPADSEGGEAGSGMVVAQGSSVSEGVPSQQQQEENASAPDGAEGVNTQSANPPGSSASSDNPTSHLREIIGHLKEVVDSLEQQLLCLSEPQRIATATNAGTSSVELLTDLLLQPTNSESDQADAAASPQCAGSRANTASALAQVLDAVRIRIFASEIINSRSGDGVARTAGESSTEVQVLRREISTMQRIEALLTELERIEFLSSGAADESEAGSARVGSGAGSGEGQADSGAASSSISAAAAAAAASADAERGSRHGAAATEDVEGSSSGSIIAMVEEERRSTSERLRVAIEDTIGNVLSLTSLTPSTSTREEAVMKLAAEFSSPSGARDEEEKARAAAEKRCEIIFMLRIESFWDFGIMMQSCSIDYL